MILGINFTNVDKDKDMYKLMVAKVTKLEDDDLQYTLHYIQEMMKYHDVCIIVPDRNSYPYAEGSISTFNNLVYFIKNKFTSYSKANHDENLYRNFIYHAGLMHGKITTIKNIEETMINMRSNI